MTKAKICSYPMKSRDKVVLSVKRNCNILHYKPCNEGYRFPHSTSRKKGVGDNRRRVNITSKESSRFRNTIHQFDKMTGDNHNFTKKQ